MELIKTKFPDLQIIKPDIFSDFRGETLSVYNTKLGKQAGVEFREFNIMTSRKGVLRGINYTPSCWKIYQCLQGMMYYVFVACDEKDPEFGQWEAVTLTDRNRLQIIKPPRFGTGFYALTDCAVLWIQDFYYEDKTEQITYKYDDKRFDIYWPIEYPITSERHRVGDSSRFLKFERKTGVINNEKGQ